MENKEWKAPTGKHKPIVSVSNYDRIDGRYAHDTDAKALSLGFAQYNKLGTPRDQREISLKIWRRDKRGWKRMSEEMPIHRNLDLSILFIKTLIEGYNQQSFLVSPEQKLTSHPQNGSIQEIMDYYEKNKSFLEPRLKELKRLLEEWL